MNRLKHILKVLEEEEEALEVAHATSKASNIEVDRLIVKAKKEEFFKSLGWAKGRGTLIE